MAKGIVKSIETVTGEKNGKTWTRYDIQYECEGEPRTARTFDTVIAKNAGELVENWAELKFIPKKDKDGNEVSYNGKKQWDLVGVGKPGQVVMPTPQNSKPEVKSNPKPSNETDKEVWEAKDRMYMAQTACNCAAEMAASQVTAGLSKDTKKAFDELYSVVLSKLTQAKEGITKEDIKKTFDAKEVPLGEDDIPLDEEDKPFEDVENSGKRK